MVSAVAFLSGTASLTWSGSTQKIEEHRRTFCCNFLEMDSSDPSQAFPTGAGQVFAGVFLTVFYFQVCIADIHIDIFYTSDQ